MQKQFFLSVFLFTGILSLQAQNTDSLTLKIGQMVLIGMPEARVDPVVLEEVRNGKVGSVIYFEKNVPKTNSYAELKKMSWTYQKAARVPLFICIDQEGGKVNRLKEKYGMPRSITAAAMGKNKTFDSVRFYANSTATTLAGLGINVNFAPCVDVAINPDNPVIVKVERSFSANEDTVTRMAIEFIKEHRKANVITTLKHFPGHGSSKDDTHLGIADVTHTWTEKELKPYKAIIDSGYADAIMTSHIVNFNLDKNGYPGTLSKEILDGILRKRLGFNGVVFSDDMQMHAITKHYGLEEAIKLAINAGVDIMCFSNNIQGSEDRSADRIHQIIQKFLKSGEIKMERIDESYKRIMSLKYRLNHPAYEAYQQKLMDAQARALRAEQEAQKAAQQARQNEEQAQKQIEILKQQTSKQKSKKKKIVFTDEL